MSGFMLFAGEAYYPGGGWEDYVGTYDTLDEAKAHFTHTRRHQWAHIVCGDVMVADFDGYTTEGEWTERRRLDVSERPTT